MREPTQLTRRAAITGGASVAVAVSLPALAAGAHPDAELLALAKDFERLHREWQDLDEAASRLEPPISTHFDSTKHTMEDLWRCRKEAGYEAAVAVAGDRLEQLDTVANRMRELPPQTLQGLAAKARVVQFLIHLSHPGMEGPEREWEWDVRCMEHFVREIEHFASIHATGGLNA